jgi:hypothetical protein
MVTVPLGAAQLLVEMAEELAELSEGESEAVDDVRHRIGRAIRRQVPR